MIHGNWLAYWAQLAPDKTALVELDSGERVSYRELDARADRCAHMLRAEGIDRGARVALLGQNRLEQVVVWFAAAKLGAVVVPVNWRLAADEVAFVLGDAAPAVLFYGADVAELVAALPPDGWDGLRVGFDDAAAGGFAARLAAAETQPVTTEGLSDDSPLMLLYTSGTTGRPKGAVLTHGSISWNAVNTAIGWDLHHDDVTLTHTPFFHTGGWNVLTLPLLHRGGTVLLARKFDPAQTLEAIGAHGVSVLFAVPTMFQMMLDSPALDAAELASVRFFVSGGAACPVPLIRAFAERGVVFKQGYGLTEVGPNCFVLDERDAIRRAGWVGVPMLHLDTRIVDGSGREVGPDEVGELQLRGPTVCAGYWNRPEATAAALSPEGWFATGDLFKRDADGYHQVVGRLKEMYISGGENVYPAEVERVLYQFAGVKEAAVIGVPDAKWGEVGHAFVAFDPAGDGAPDSQVLLAHCKQHLARFKVPKALTVLAELPKNPSGKIHKQQLREASP